MDLFHSPDFATRVEYLIKKHHTPGLAIAIVHKDRIASAAFGFASLGHAGHADAGQARPMTPDTLFDIASASKSLTAASVALLVDDEEKHPEVKYGARMSDLLPGEFFMPGEKHNDVTLDDALSHRTGLSSNDLSYFGTRASRPDDAQSVTRNIRNLLIAAPLRTRYIYCNCMYTAVAHLVEVKSGLSFSDFLSQKFFVPLDMNSSFVQPNQARDRGQGDRLTQGHFWDKNQKEYLSFEYPDTPEGLGAGSVVTSVNDYIKYVRAMMNKEAPFTDAVYNNILKPRMIVGEEDMEKPYPYSSPQIYTSGWHMHHYRGYNIVAHDGCISGCATTHMFLPDLEFGCVAFGNADGASTVITTLIQELIDDALELPQEQRLDWERQQELVDMNLHRDDQGRDDEEDWLTFFPGIKECQPQERALALYSGHYWHAGYLNIKVQIRNGQLFVDANDRSFPFTLTFKHVSDQTKFVAYLSWTTEPTMKEPVRAQFRFGDSDDGDGTVVTGMGLALDEDVDELIWFDRLY